MNADISNSLKTKSQYYKTLGLSIPSYLNLGVKKYRPRLNIIEHQ